MLMPDDFKAYSKIKVDNHLFNKWVKLTALIFNSDLEKLLGYYIHLI